MKNNLKEYHNSLSYYKEVKEDVVNDIKEREDAIKNLKDSYHQMLNAAKKLEAVEENMKQSGIVMGCIKSIVRLFEGIQRLPESNLDVIDYSKDIIETEKADHHIDISLINRILDGDDVNKERSNAFNKLSENLKKYLNSISNITETTDESSEEYLNEIKSVLEEGSSGISDDLKDWLNNLIKTADEFKQILTSAEINKTAAEKYFKSNEKNGYITGDVALMFLKTVSKYAEAIVDINPTDTVSLDRFADFTYRFTANNLSNVMISRIIRFTGNNDEDGSLVSLVDKVNLK